MTKAELLYLLRDVDEHQLILVESGTGGVRWAEGLR